MSQRLTAQDVLSRVAIVADVSTETALKVFYALLTEAYICYSEHQAGNLEVPEEFLVLGKELHDGPSAQPSVLSSQTLSQTTPTSLPDPSKMTREQALDLVILVIEAAFIAGKPLLGEVLDEGQSISIKILGVPVIVPSDEKVGLAPKVGAYLPFKILSLDKENKQIRASHLAYEEELLSTIQDQSIQLVLEHYPNPFPRGLSRKKMENILRPRLDASEG